MLRFTIPCPECGEPIPVQANTSSRQEPGQLVVDLQPDWDQLEVDHLNHIAEQ